jgi:two-component system nitrate/nitrite response regulator NarL
MIRILLVNEIRLMGNVIAEVLDDEPDIQVVAYVDQVEDALELVQAGEVDIVLVSTRMPHNGALMLTQAIAENDPEIKVLALGVSDNKERILQFVEAGAAGYIRRDDSVEDLLESIREAEDDRAQVSTKIAAALMARVAELTELLSKYQEGISPEFEELTPRELEVLDLIARGYSNQRIADHLFIEVGTVKNHVHNILKKLEVGSREDAAAYLAIVRQQQPPFEGIEPIEDLEDM